MRSYSIEDLLIDQFYAPTSYRRKFQGGIINFAEKRDDVWVGTDYQAYSIRYRQAGSIRDEWATVAVKVSDL
jgi:hypothetical protein